MGLLGSFAHLVAESRRREREQWLPPAALAALRATRLRRLARAASKTRYYGAVFAGLGLAPGDLTEAGLERFPLLDKATLQSEPPDAMTTLPPGTLSAVTTSGSTGVPLRVLRTARDQAAVSAVWRRVLAAYGHGVRSSQVNINTGRPVAASGPVAMLRRARLLPGIHHISCFEPVDRQVELLRRVRPHTFSGFAVSLELVAERILELGITDVRPAVVFSAAMPLSERGRALAERAFGRRPLDVYVTSELGTVAWECPTYRDALHLNDDVQITEILDERGRPVEPGQTGEVVVTSLHTLAQPLIRYRIGDLAARLPGRCECGRGLARLTRVQGRTRHVVRTPDGRVLFGMPVARVLVDFPEVRRWQLRQDAPADLRLLVVPGNGWSPETPPAIERALVQRFGPGLRFSVVPTDDIPLAPGGKFQAIVPLEGGPTAG